MPFYTLTWPEAARALLLYRYHTLPAARAKAARLGYRGALYAWESADTGDEATPTHVVGPDGMVIPILCGTQEQHISAALPTRSGSTGRSPRTPRSCWTPAPRLCSRQHASEQAAPAWRTMGACTSAR